MQQTDEKEITATDLTEEQLQAIYVYLSMNYDEMTVDEKLYWNIALEKLDPEYGN
jgi:hypothetical protein